jgi:hypothetical protein
VKTIAGAIVILAASIMLSAAVIGQSTMVASNHSPDNMPGLAMVVAFIVGFLGVILVAIGILDETGRRGRPQP